MQTELSTFLSETIDQRADRLVRQEVLCCLSSMVSTLAKSYGATARDCGEDLVALIDQAFELASPIPDYKEAAVQAGWSAADGLFIHNAGTPDEDRKSSGASPEDACGWENLCAEHDIEPYDREVYEYWAVTDWFGGRLRDAGEKVDSDFTGLTVWARTTTGQAISMDGVIQRLAAEFLT